MGIRRKTLRSAIDVVARHLPSLESGPPPSDDERQDFVRRVVDELATSWSINASAMIDESGPVDRLAASLTLASAHAWSDQTGASWSDESLGMAVSEGLKYHWAATVPRLVNTKTFVAILDSELKARSIAESNIRRRDIEFLSASPEHRRETLSGCFELFPGRRNRLAGTAAAALLVIATAALAFLVTNREADNRSADDREAIDREAVDREAVDRDDTGGQIAVPIQPVPPADGDPPPGDHYRPTRPNNNVGLVMAPGETLVLDVDVDAPGWLLLELRCEGESEVRQWPELDLALSVVADSQPVYWAPPDPATDCHRALIQGPVEQGHYYYQVQVAPTEDQTGTVGLIARYVKAPVEPFWDGRVVVPKIETRPENSLTGTVSPGAVDAYQFFLSRNHRLQFNFNCETEQSPEVVPLRVRVVDLDNSEIDDRIVDDCVPFSTTLPRDGRYEVQIMAANPEEEVSYRLAALLR